MKVRNKVNLGWLSAGKKTSSAPPLIIGEWADPKDVRTVFRSDGYWTVGTVNVPYALEDAGQTLVVNGSTRYTRLSHDPALSFAGHWFSQTDQEEIYYRDDGQYIGLSLANELWAYRGTYTYTATTFTSYEYRGWYETSGDRLTMWLHWGTHATMSYDMDGDTMTITAPGQDPVVYRRIVADV